MGNWVLEKHIGSGSFAVVWKARHCRTGEVMAIKEISLDKLNRKLKQSLESEVSILRRITHQNVVKLHDVIEVRTVHVLSGSLLATVAYDKHRVLLLSSVTLMAGPEGCQGS